MNHYGSNDGVEVTLHDVVAQLRVGTVNDSETPGFYRIGGWEKPAPEAEQQDLYLRYSDESATHEYVWNNKHKPKSGTRFTTDEGFIRAAVKQDAESCDQNHGIGTWDDLGTKDITNLFTGSTVIHVTNHRVASLEVEKQVVIPEGLTGPVDWKDKDFTFVFEFKDKDGKPLAGEFDARVFGADGVQRGDDFKIASRGTHTLKHGEVMRVYGLPDGATYTVSEPVEQMPEGFTQTLPLDGAGKPTTAAGAIKLGDTSRVLFENTYTPAPAILDTAATLQVKKEFVDAEGKPAWGLEFNAKPAFTFVLDTDPGTPMPGDATLNENNRLQSTIVIDREDAQAGYAQSFGAIHYEHPGTYLYALAEKTPDAADRIPGVSYSDAAYRVVVTVSDDKAGKLVADVRLRKLADDAGVPQGDNDAGVPQGDNDAGVPVEPQNGVHTAFFKNVFALNEVQIGPLATKVLNGRGFTVDGSGAGEFTFRMRPAGAHAADAPMPAGTAGDGASRYSEVHNKGSMLSFGQPTFRFEHLNGADKRTGRFDYELFEVIPDDAVNADGVRWDAATADQKLAGGFAKQGMTYDSTRFVARVNLMLQDSSLKRTGGTEALVATIDYFQVTRLNEQGAWTGSNNDLTPVEHTPGGADRVEFHNTYRAAASTAGIRLTKTLEGRDMKDKEFSFTIEGADKESRKLLAETDKSFSAPAAMSGEKAVMDGKLQLKFDQSHAGRTYTYYIKEVTPLWGGEQIPGLVGGWDNSIYRLEYRVIDNLDGTLKVVPRLYRTYDRSGAIVNIPLDLGTHTDSSGVITLDFVNRYSASTTFAGIEVAKTMHGKDLEDKQFGFTLEPVDPASAQKMLDRGLPADEEQLERIFAAGEAPEGEPHLMEKLKGLKFTQADTGKTYSYRVKENVDPAWDEDGEAPGVQADGVTYDRSQFLVSIAPADKGDGTMKTVTTVKRTHDARTGDQLAEPELIGTWDSDNPAEGQAEKPRVPFVNRYKARPGALQFDRFTKRLVGRDWSAADSFEFTCEQMSFSSGGHDYKPGDEGFVSVPLVVAPVNAESPQNENGFKLFGISTSPDVLYEQSGRYDYRLREKVPDDARNAAGVRYENATDEQKAAGGFVKDGVVYSNREVRFTVSTFDLGTGDVFAIGPILKDGPQEDGAYFTNKVRRADTALMAKKVLEGRSNPLTEGEFSFVLAPVDGGQPLVSSNDAEGNVRFSGLTFDEPGVHQYTLREVHEAPQANGVTFDDAVYDVTVNVTEAAGGELVPEVSVFKDGKPVEGVPVFTNRYESTVDYSALGGLKITKVLNGRDMADGQFAFTVKATGDDAEAIAAAASKLGFAEGQTKRVFLSHTAKDGAVDTIDILAGLPDGLVFTQADAGKTFAYEVRESRGGKAGYVNDQTVYDVSIAVVDDGAGTLTVTTTVTGGAEGEKTYVYTSGQKPEEVEPVVLPFVNSYAAQGDVSIATSKVLHGRPLEAGEFSFELRTGDGAAGSSEVIARAENATDGTVDFGKIEFTLDTLAEAVDKGYATRDAQGIWHVRYTAVEIVDGLPDGVSATTQSLSFEVSVEDKGDGTLAATVQGLDGHSFENTYVTDGGEPVSMALVGRKVLTYAEGLAPADITGKFTFTVSGEDGAPMPERTEVTNAKDGSVDFGMIKFTLDDFNRKWATEHPEDTGLEALADGEAAARSGKPRTVSFTYTITESGEVPGVTNDQDASRTVTFTVTDDGSGRLTVTRDPAEGASFTFTNAYTVDELSSSVTDQIAISKDLTGKPLAQDAFTFVLTELVDDGAGADLQVLTATNGADGRIAFPALTYTEPGVHTYRLAEVVDENVGGIEFDKAVYTVRTTVVDNGDGTLSATHEVLDESGNKVDAVVFANAYDPVGVTVPLMAFKMLTGRMLEDGEFSFELVDADGTVLQTVSNDERGNVAFTPLRYTAEDLADAAWVDQDGVISRARELAYAVREVVPADAVNADGVRWSDATEQQRATGGFVKDDVVYDGRAFTVTVALSDDGGGALSATASWSEPPVFQNVYDRPEEPGDPGSPHVPDGPVGGGKLPSTGTSLVPTVGVAIAGVAVAGLGIWLARRKR
ncbi:Spy0128 family protein [Collinsella stercoris]|uniref:Spy0128 family protein n=1 Tax=Collinsella stercoris TaxID=147206 RepID=UPI003990EAF1